jgi:hypothetical protein
MTRSGVVAFCGHARHLLGMTPHRVSQRGVRRALGAIVRTAVCSGMLGATALTAVLAGTVVAQPRAALPNQGADSPAIPRTPATTPLFGDTIGYWQQRADYRIVATLDDTRGVLSAEGTLRYVNQSPDTLRELWLHQHLNAFRPGSRWSDTDEREGRSRFQRLTEPDFGYERFTRAPRIDGQTVRVTYPLAPDSTVVHLALPRPLAPRDSVAVELAWTARPSTLARRQGRRDRSVDFAQWYPKVAVYDRHGWKPNALVPAGEFHGEFGTFDVTLIVADDQVLGATGVPVSGDPGWQRVAVAGHSVDTRADAYGRVPEVPAVTVPPGARAVRFYARDVHHFAWSASPGFRYEGGRHVRTAPIGAYRFTAWDTVAVHVLYRGDADSDCTRQVASAPEDQRTRLREACIASSRTQWENGRALAFGLTTLSWLEQAFGTYPYPQLTILKRIDGGGTEFPMMMQNGSASQGLTTHEGGHIYVYGILASNEWQSGWMDEGLTSYQTSMQTGATRSAVSAALAALNPADPSALSDATLASRALALRNAADARNRAVAAGSVQPIGTRADLFRDFATYNGMVYGRAAAMYESLHDVLGDDAFRAFLREYYARWAFRHVDRWAMQASAERASGQSLGWFFDQWVDSVGVVDYALTDASVERAAGRYVTRVTLTRRGGYRHPMPVGVRTAAGWSVVRADPALDRQVLVLETRDRPAELRLDPFGATDVVAPSRVEIP